MSRHHLWALLKLLHLGGEGLQRVLNAYLAIERRLGLGGLRFWYHEIYLFRVVREQF